MYVGTAVAAVTLAKAVVVHAVLLLLLLLASVSDYGEAPLNCATGIRRHRQTTSIHQSISSLLQLKRTNYARISFNSHPNEGLMGSSILRMLILILRLLLALQPLGDSDERPLILEGRGRGRIRCYRLGWI